MMSFPSTRLRRLRYNPLVRQLVQETTLSAKQFILPLFVRSGNKVRQAINSMPGNFQLSIDELVKEAEECVSLGIGGIILFGIPDVKDSAGSDAMNDNGIIAQAVRAVKDALGNQLLVITDVCFCEYTDHGHCGVLSPFSRAAVPPLFDVDNDKTLENLVKQTLVHARAGADMVAPSGMMDGMIGALRTGLDGNGFSHIPIMSYAAKYASAFYGPFREAADSAPHFGDRRSYQMDFAAAASQAVREVALDLEEGADIVMVKPALAYLDIVHLVKERFEGVPLAVYNVSGEFSMVKAAAERGWIDEQRVVLESLTAMTRAGADIILTYWAKDAARWLREL
ncbi:delta-aminolevulinic acid dehydratase [Planctomycetales bacterium]|nr:delta-aminolevulinic acid dehydratase [Planctomycetales bacterium]GHT34854.1 delta-aminolevulinic acid dehydratase [Planctomycetales bacterium]